MTRGTHGVPALAGHAAPGAWLLIPYFCAGWNSWAEPGRISQWRKAAVSLREGKAQKIKERLQRPLWRWVGVGDIGV